MDFYGGQFLGFGTLSQCLVVVVAAAVVAVVAGWVAAVVWGVVAWVVFVGEVTGVVARVVAEPRVVVPVVGWPVTDVVVSPNSVVVVSSPRLVEVSSVDGRRHVAVERDVLGDPRIRSPVPRR